MYHKREPDGFSFHFTDDELKTGGKIAGGIVVGLFIIRAIACLWCCNAGE